MRLAPPKLLVFLLAALLVTGASFAQDAKREARPLLVGTVDIGVVFQKYERKNDLERRVNKQKGDLETKFNEQKQKLDKLRRELDLVRDDTEESRDKTYEIKLAIKETEVMRERMDEDLKRMIEDLTLTLLDEINAAAHDYGKKNGYDAIFKVDSKGWGGEKFQERIFRAQVSSMLYSSRELDLTDKILEILNDPENLKARRAR